MYPGLDTLGYLGLITGPMFSGKTSKLLDIYIKSLTISAVFVFYSMNVKLNEYYFVLFFLIVSIILHFASKRRIRNYFN